MVQLAPSSVGGFASDECSRHLEREEIFVRSLRVVLWSENPTNILHLGISNKNSDQLHYLLQGDIQVRHIMPCHAMIDWSYIWPPYFIIGFPDKWWQILDDDSLGYPRFMNPLITITIMLPRHFRWIQSIISNITHHLYLYYVCIYIYIYIIYIYHILYIHIMHTYYIYILHINDIYTTYTYIYIIYIYGI